MTTKNPGTPAKPLGKAAVVDSDTTCETDEQRAEARRMQDALEDDEVRQALNSLHVDRTGHPIR